MHARLMVKGSRGLCPTALCRLCKSYSEMLSLLSRGVLTPELFSGSNKAK